MRHRTNLVLACLAVLLVTAPDSGWTQARCDPGDTYATCWAKYLPDDAVATEEAKAAAKEKSDAQEALANKATGIDTGGSNLATNTKNFVPLLALSGLLGEPTEGDTEGTLVFDLNFLVPGLAESKNAQLQGVVNTAPVVSEAVKMALPDEMRDDLTKELESGLTDLDDYTLSFTYNLTGQKWGRSFKQHRETFGQLALEARSAVDVAVDDRIFALTRGFQPVDIEAPFREWKHRLSDHDLDAMDEQINRLSERQELVARLLEATESEIATCANAHSACTQLQSISLLRDSQRLEEERDAIVADLELLQTEREEGARLLSEDEVFAAIAILEREAQATADLEKAFAKAHQEAGLTSFADLADNQPQLHFSLNLKERDSLVGADETSLKLTYEWSAVSLNKALTDSGCESLAGGGRASCLQDYTEYVENNKDQIETSGRFSFAVEYVDVDETDVDLSRLEVEGLENTALEGSEKLIVGLGWSRDFGQSGQQSEPVRLDLDAKYEDVSDDPNRQDRLIATLTVTKKVGDISIPFGIVYANHGEFLPDVDEHLSAHFGLKFDLTAIKKD